MSEKTVKIELELTAEEYQRMVEYHFAGSLALEPLYFDGSKSHMKLELGLATKLNKYAPKFGKDNLVFTHPDLGEYYTVSKELEERVLSCFQE